MRAHFWPPGRCQRRAFRSRQSTPLPTARLGSFHNHLGLASESRTSYRRRSHSRLRSTPSRQYLYLFTQGHLLQKLELFTRTLTSRPTREPTHIVTTISPEPRHHRSPHNMDELYPVSPRLPRRRTTAREHTYQPCVMQQRVPSRTWQSRSGCLS